MELANKHTVITGGASGIGAATAREFARLGARVVVADMNGDGAHEVAAEVGGKAIVCDVSVEADVNALVADAERDYGKSIYSSPTPASPAAARPSIRTSRCGISSGR